MRAHEKSNHSETGAGRVPLCGLNNHSSSHKASQKLPICYYDSKLRHASNEYGGNDENPPERKRNEEKHESKLPTAIARVTRRPRSSRPHHSIANCAAHRLNMVLALFDNFSSAYLQKSTFSINKIDIFHQKSTFSIKHLYFPLNN